MARLRTSPLRAGIAKLLIAACACFSGAALLANILVGVRFPTVLAMLAAFVVLVGLIVWRRTPLAYRPVLRHASAVGVKAGVVAAAAYDASKAIFSLLDATPYNPFEVLRVFGVLLSGSSNPWIAYAVGSSYHLLNGAAFGVAYCLLFGRFGILAGIAWGLGLESLQLWLYPGWLNIKFYREFVEFSVLGHVVYGSVLGVLCRNALRARAAS